MNVINKYPLRTRLLIIVLFTFLSSALILVVLINSVEAPMKNFDRIGADSNNLKSIEELMSSTHFELDEVDEVNFDDIRKNYSSDYTELKNSVAGMDMFFPGYDSYYEYENIKGMIDSYGKTVEEAFECLENDDVQGFINEYYNADTIRQYVETASEKLIVRLYSESDEIRETISKQLKLFSVIVPAVIGLLGIMLASLVMGFRRWVTDPLYKLEEVAKAISVGNYYDEKLDFGNDEELNTLSNSMYEMSCAIKEKQELMQKLHKGEMENLSMKAEYNKLELQRLQEQINPHFLFNILSTLQHTAFIEGAGKTCNLINSTAKLLRYSLEESRSIVTLDEEISALKNYLIIQNERFGNRVKTVLTYEKIPDIELPGLTLQPLVENCYSHGLKDVVSDGRINIDIKEIKKEVIITIEDNGCGMTEELMHEYRKLFIYGYSDAIPVNKIGLWNAINRIQIYYEKKDLVEISSNPGLKIVLKLPLDDMEEI